MENLSDYFKSLLSEDEYRSKSIYSKFIEELYLSNIKEAHETFWWYLYHMTPRERVDALEKYLKYLEYELSVRKELLKLGVGI